MTAGRVVKIDVGGPEAVLGKCVLRSAYLLSSTALVKQVHRDPSSQAVVQEWIKERETMR